MSPNDDNPLKNFRCCMCPAKDGQSVCDPCKFIKKYRDDREWTYFVRAGLSGKTFKTFYSKPGKGAHGYRNLFWRERFDEAQLDLNQLAMKKGWTDIKSKGPQSADRVVKEVMPK